ncbi:MAG: restriction endonuclease subunit S [Gemmatimonadetes bacterium]|nr:restriction endonuclease subunit S [Gemmatimonadota bacterium]MYD25236.1 restriction endonuclease subunit S [Gemmatimonadota bacterium]
MEKVPIHREGRICLSDLGKFIKGRGITRADLVQSGIPCLRYGDLYTTYGDVTDELTSFVSEDTARRATQLHHGDIIFASSGETAGEIGKSVAWLGNGTAVAGGDTIILRGHGQDPTFLAHALNADDAVRQKSRLGKGHSVVHIHEAELARVSVFLPPVSEQRKIGEILRTWDEATEKLEALRQAKTVQYRLVSQGFFDPCHPSSPGHPRTWLEVELGDLFRERIQTGNSWDTLLSITMSEGVIDRNEVDRKDTSTKDKSRYKLILRGDLGYNTMRMWQGVSGLSALRGIVSPAYTVVTPDQSKIIARYASHLFKARRMVFDFQRYSQGLTSDTWNLKFPAFSKIRIFLPPIKLQEKQADLLDAFKDEIKCVDKEVRALKNQKRGLIQILLNGNNSR